MRDGIRPFLPIVLRDQILGKIMLTAQAQQFGYIFFFQDKGLNSPNSTRSERK